MTVTVVVGKGYQGEMASCRVLKYRTFQNPR